MTRREAVEILRRGGRLAQLAEAIGTVADDRGSALDDILLGLNHSGFVAEQAALALYARTARPLPEVADAFALDADEWRQWLARHGDEGRCDATGSEATARRGSARQG